MLLNARQVFYKEGAETTILLGIEDVTVRRALEHEKDDLLRQKDILLEEIQHRIANSLQIIAGIILMKANAVVLRRHASFCETLTIGSFRSRPFKNSSMHRGQWGLLKCFLISNDWVLPSRRR